MTTPPGACPRCPFALWHPHFPRSVSGCGFGGVLIRSAGALMRPYIPAAALGLHRPTGTASSDPGIEALCPRRRTPLYHGSPTGPSLPRGCSVRGVFGTTARSARLAPTDRLRLIAYTVRPAVRGRSRRGTSPSQFLRRVPCRRAAAHTPQGSPGALARLFPGDTSLRPSVPGSAPCDPGTHFCRDKLTTRQHSLYATAR